MLDVLMDVVGFLGEAVLFWSIVLFLAWCFQLLAVRAVGKFEVINLEYFHDYVRSEMNRRGWHFTDDGSIEMGSGPATYRVAGTSCPFIWRIANVVFYIRPFVRTTPYAEHNDEDGFKVKGKDDVISLRPQQKEISIPKADSAVPAGGDSESSVPQDFKGFFKEEPGNLPKFTYESTNDVVAKSVETMESVVRKVIRQLTPNELQDANNIWAKAYEPGSETRADIDRLLTEDGIRIVPNSIKVLAVDYSEARQKALEKKSIEILDAQAFAAGINAIKLGLIAGELGMTPDELRDKIAAEPDFRKSDDYKAAAKASEATDMAKREQAAKKGELRDWRIGSPNGGDFHGNIIMMPGGGGKRGRH